ncbi:MAG: 16S rRNA (adenine(1518)-N(6)/adenine(1519)-N(6))-dimethyltransferase RsmA [Acidobacteriia bacterium]|nr:16S rRNA (adenine(1518)-N(6)/adenine(1519)-N(6))-dimethyltransferase RsmA [Terriglobia bacterium]
MGRRLGQHFLNRKSTLNHIAEAACPEGSSGERTPLVIEIGAGRGALTECLLERADKVVAIELDPVLVQYLRQKFRDALDAGRLILVESDILKADLGAWGPAVIAGNLPYYITSPILERIFAAGASCKRAVILVQAEVATRIVAQPGSRDYGYLSVLVQVQARAERLFEVPRAAFRPPPKVDSAVVCLEPGNPAKDLRIEDLPSFLKFAGHCFRYKRKTLRNNLAGLYDRLTVESLVGPKDRAEALSVAELARLFQALTTRQSVVYPT